MARRIPVPLQFTGGVNRFNRARDLRDDEVVSAKNLYPKLPGKLSTRPSSEVALFMFTHKPVYIGITPFSSDTPIVVIDRDVANGQNTRLVASPVNTLLAPPVIADFGIVTPYIPAVLYYNERILAFGGADTNANGKVIEKVGGATVAADFAFTGANNSVLRPQVVAQYLDRIVYGNLGRGFESALTFSDPLLPEVITPDALAANGGYALVSPGDGDRIIAMVSLAETGGAPVRSTLLVLKEYSAHLLTGQPALADGTDMGAFDNIRMPVNCGCSSAATVINTGFGIIWASHDDVWFFAEGQLPYRIGTKLRPLLQATPKNARYKWHAAYFDGFYRLALFAEGQGPGDDSLCEEQWWLDLRSGPPRSWQEAQWWGPQVYKNIFLPPSGTLQTGTASMFAGSIPGQENSLYMIGPSDFGVLVGAYTLVGTSDHDTTSTPDAQAAGTEIEQEIITKEYVRLVQGERLVSDEIQEKGLQGVEMDIFTSRNSQLRWYWILNQGVEVSDAQEVVLSKQGFILDLNEVDEDRLSSPRLSVGLDPAPERPVGKAIQLKIQSRFGYIIDSTNDRLAIEIDGIPYEVTLAHEFHPSMTEYIESVADAITAQTGIEVTAAFAANLVRFTATNGETLELNSAAPVSVTVIETSRVIAAELGFTDYDGAGYTGTSITATAQVYSAVGPILEFEEIMMWFYAIGRRTL